MGHHFVPQAYLRPFEFRARPGFIWVHSRRDERPKLASIVEVAQARAFYDPDTEKLLASAIEGPANPILAKLRAGELPTASEHVVLAVYIATLIKRVPRNRVRAHALAQPALDGVAQRFREQVEEMAALGQVPPELAERRLQELEKAHEKLTRELPPQIVEQIRDPRPTPIMIEALLAMRWRLLRAKDPHFFITCDNPAFYHEAYGLGTEKAEVRLPLSPSTALHGCQISGLHGVFSIHEVPKDWVREFNRSVVSGASSIAMAHERAPFIGKLLRRRNPYLSRLVWDAA